MKIQNIIENNVDRLIGSDPDSTETENVDILSVLWMKEDGSNHRGIFDKTSTLPTDVQEFLDNNKS